MLLLIWRVFGMATQVYKSVIAGAGPAGLTAAYDLSKLKQPVVVLESDREDVGGISRTVKYKGFHFDIGRCRSGNPRTAKNDAGVRPQA